MRHHIAEDWVEKKSLVPREWPNAIRFDLFKPSVIVVHEGWFQGWKGWWCCP
jgi:hypothetical protein